MSIDVPHPLITFTLDHVERNIFIADSTGRISKKSLIHSNQNSDDGQVDVCTDKKIDDICISSDSNYLFACSENVLLQYDSNTLQMLKSLNYSSNIASIECVLINPRLFDASNSEYINPDPSGSFDSIFLPKSTDLNEFDFKTISRNLKTKISELKKRSENSNENSCIPTESEETITNLIKNNHALYKKAIKDACGTLK